MAREKQQQVPFGGYYRQPVLQENEILTHVGPGTPGGEYLRRFWHPVAMASEVGELPYALRILGEDLVLFRDRGGRLGLVHRQCCHRGASLEFGIPSERGLRCCYHGWLFDIDGKVLETPGEPPDSKLKDYLYLGAYPTAELGGLIFAYMGPPEEKPPLPIYDAFVWPDDNRMVPYKLHFPCNWLQVHENGADPIHTAFLHAIVADIQFTPVFTAVPSIDFHETPLGMLSVATRRWGGNMYIRASDVILPNGAQFGTGFVTGEREKIALCAGLTRWVTPIDDESCWTMGVRHYNSAIDPLGEGDPEQVGLGKVDFMGQTGDRPYADRQRNPGDWDAQMSQRRIAVHANEHFGTTDRGVSLLRRMIRRGIDEVQNSLPLSKPHRYAEGAVVPTYNIELVVDVPSQANADTPVLTQRFGQRVSDIVIGSRDLEPAERRQVVDAGIRRMIQEEFVA
jgi:nitrite reductase/ring-hydroxylating ferredoxin subunit